MARSYDLFASMLPEIRALPQCRSLLKEDLLTDRFLLHRETYRGGALEIYYAPLEYVNEEAKVVLIGVSPGWKQMETAYRTARYCLEAGQPAEEVLRHVSADAGVMGPARANLVMMLDGIGLHEALDIRSCSQLFRDRAGLALTTFAVKYPVFVRGRDYPGHSPDVLEHPVLKKCLFNGLSEGLRAARDALLVPLGKSAARALQRLACEGYIGRERCLPGFPHPSGANGIRVRQYDLRREELARGIRGWFGK